MFFTSGLEARRVYLLILSILVCLTVPSLAFAKTHAIINSNVEVSEELASFVAGKTAWNYHRTTAQASSDVYYNTDGSIAAYVYSYWLDNVKKPLGISLQTVAELKQDKALLATLSPANSSLEEREAALANLRQTENELRYRDEAVTVIVSASLASPPILDRFFGIPHHIYKEPLYYHSNGVKTAASDKQVLMLSVNELYFFSLPAQPKTRAASSVVQPLNSGTSLLSVNSGLQADVGALQVQANSQQQHSVGAKHATQVHDHWKMYKQIFDNRVIAK